MLYAITVFGKGSIDRQYSTQLCFMLYCYFDLSPHTIIVTCFNER